MQLRMNLTAVPSLLLLVMYAASAYGQSPLTCSNATIRGEHGFTATGQILGPVAGPVTGTGLIVFDGKGNLTEVDHIVNNGNPPPLQWRHATGTYTVNADCTGTAELDVTDGSPPIHLSMVVVRRGLEILYVVDNPGSAITSISIKRDSPL